MVELSAFHCSPWAPSQVPSRDRQTCNSSFAQLISTIRTFDGFEYFRLPHLAIIVEVRVEPDGAGSSGLELHLGRAVGVLERKEEVELVHTARVRSVLRPVRQDILTRDSHL